MINENKIIDFLHNDLKCALYEVTVSHQIVVKSSIANLEKLILFVTPLNYYVSFVGNARAIYINPK